jgi:hypothetical protein
MKRQRVIERRLSFATRFGEIIETLACLQAERERIHAELDKWQVPRCDNVTLRIEELGAQARTRVCRQCADMRRAALAQARRKP